MLINMTFLGQVLDILMWIFKVDVHPFWLNVVCVFEYGALKSNESARIGTFCISSIDK